MAEVRLKQLVKRYDKQEIIKGIDLHVQDGEFVVLVGPSGCGKSTTLRMIAGLEDINAGTIEIAGRAVNDLQPHLRNIAMVFQNYALYPHKTVKDNILFGLRKSKVSRAVMDDRLKQVATMLQLEELLNRKPADLSGGQRQRVAMGRALVRDADVFLFDEPLSNLDAKLRHHMRTEIARIHQNLKTTFIYVTHDQVEAMTLGDRVVVMWDGEIEQMGTPMDIYLNPVNTFVATFIGSPSMNLIPATYRESNGMIVMADLELPMELLPGVHTANLKDKQALYVGIRPDFFEDVHYASELEAYWKLPERTIELIEPLGFDKEVSFSIGDQFVKARLDLRSDLQAGNALGLAVNPERILVFDRDNGMRVN